MRLASSAAAVWRWRADFKMLLPNVFVQLNMITRSANWKDALV
jgi:hypothetical protein